jgi:hypothetical protein
MWERERERKRDFERERERGFYVDSWGNK